MQAVIITAYDNPEQVYELANLLKDKFEVFIHFDKKANQKEIENLGFKKLPNVYVYSLFHINWGGAAHLWAILYLMKEILKNPNISYVHIISGQDFPCRSLSEIYSFFENKSDVYMEFQEIQKTGKVHMQRYYSFLDLINYKKLFHKIFVRGLWLIQKMFKVNRLEKLDFPLYSGLVWGDLPRAAIQYCFEYINKNPEFLEFLEYGFASEEFFFGTIFMQSEYWKNHCIQNNYRYMQWEKRNGSYPAILDESDEKKIKAGDYFFMRKVRMPISEKLVELFE